MFVEINEISVFGRILSVMIGRLNDFPELWYRWPSVHLSCQ